MAGLVNDKEYEVPVVNICHDGSRDGEIIVIENLPIQLPKKPKDKDILFYDLPKEQQHWRRLEPPKELIKIKSMDEWLEMPNEFRRRYEPYIVQEFERRRKGIWFFNFGEPTYITGEHYMFLQWSKIDIGYPDYYEFQRTLELHWEACVVDERSFGQIYTKCRRSGFTNLASGGLVNDGTQVKEKLLGIQSKTGDDAQENVFMKKIVPIYTSYPFFFKPIQDGTTNPRMELAFREPAKRITKTNKTGQRGEALNTLINWKNTTNGAYDGEKTYRLFIDEFAKFAKPADLLEMWRIEKTCLIVGRNIIGKARLGSTINPLDKGGREGVRLIADSDVMERDANGRTKSGLYHLFIPAYEALEGFFDIYGKPVVEDPKKPIMGIDGKPIDIGAKTYLKNTRRGLENDARELNEHVRQFPWTIGEACRDSVNGSTFNLGKIYQQIEHNMDIYPNPVIRGNFVWRGGVRDSVVDWHPSPEGRFWATWLPSPEQSNKKKMVDGMVVPANDHIGVGGVDSYDINQTVDARSSKGAFLFFNKFHMDDTAPTNTFVLEYAERPPTATMFYEDLLMASVYYGYPLLIENNKRRVIVYFEERGYIGYVMKKPDFLRAKNSRYTMDDYGVPTNSADVIDQHAQAIEAYIEDFVGFNQDKGVMGNMYFHRTLEDWIKFRIDDRTKSDLSIAAGFSLLGAQRKRKEKKIADLSKMKWVRTYKFNA